MARIYEWGPAELEDDLVSLLSRFPGEILVFRRPVKGGELRAIRTCEDPGRVWNLLVSFIPKKTRILRRLRYRYPTYEELTDVRIELLPANVKVVVTLPEKLEDDDPHGIRLWEWREA